MIKFFLFGKEIGVMFCLMSHVPDNDFESDCNVVSSGNMICSGIKWSNADWFYNDEGVDLDRIDFKYKYVDGRIIDNEDYDDGHTD